jgi:hypothetical protein
MARRTSIKSEQGWDGLYPVTAAYDHYGGGGGGGGGCGGGGCGGGGNDMFLRRNSDHFRLQH